MLNDVLDRSIVEVYTASNGEKFLHFLGFGFLSDDDDGEKPYRFVEYTFFMAPLSEVLGCGVYKNGPVRVLKYEQKHSGEYKQYVEDCDEQECIESYTQYPVLPIELLDESTPNGVYVLI